MPGSDPACECIIRSDWPDGAVSCSAELDAPDGTFRCSRPEGHDGPHAACSPAEHPALTWGQDSDADA